MPQAQLAFVPPMAFEEIRLVRPLGQGGMGMVYLGHDVFLDRPVAVKFIASFESDLNARRRFKIEARAIARLQHPNVVSVYRVGEVDGLPFLVSELIRGHSLSRAPKPMPWKQVAHIGLGLARGLGAAHRQGVLHRDIKPGNVMLTDDGEVKLLDFGLAKLSGDLIRTSLSSDHAASLPSAQPHTDAPADPLTWAGTVVGTPVYMAPETLRGEPATRRSDVYSLGMVLYELCTGAQAHPRSGAASQPTAPVGGAYEPREPPPLTERVPAIDPAFAAVVMRCLRRDPALRFGSGDEVRDALEQLLPEGRTAPVPEGNPYRGLLPFEAEHRALFFGRGAEIRAVLERLRTEPMVLVAGDSGVGKSSLCRAGVLPLVADGALDESRTFTTLRIVPGRHPVAALAAALAPLLRLPEEALCRQMDETPGLLCTALRRCLGRRRGALLFIDQLEELVTLSQPREAAIVGRVLADLAQRTPALRLLLTARGDFLTRLAVLDRLGDEVVRALFLLRPLSADGIREAIEGPARRKQVVFESEQMIAQLVDSTSRAAGGLPLLQFALAALWEERDAARGVIPAAALRTIGGATGALSLHADGVLLGLSPPQAQAARRILTRLVTLDGTRARRTARELGRGDGATAGALEALEALIRGRLVVARQAEGETVYEMAHEALIESWGTLRRWLEADQDRRAVAGRVQAAAAEWERLGRPREALWRARQLREAAALEDRDLPQREAAFLLASRRGVRRLRYLRRTLLLGLPVLVCAGYGADRLAARREQDQLIAGHLERAGQALTRARQLRQGSASLRQGALGLFDQRGAPAATRPRAEALWQRARVQERAAEALYVDVSQVLETALLLDPGRAQVRARLGEVTFDRLLLAEAGHDDARREELALRLRRQDVDQSLSRRLQAPAVLRVEGPARVLVQRYTDRGGRLVLSPGRVLPGGAHEIPLERGSYLLSGASGSPSGSPMRLPVLLERGERRSVWLAPPAPPPPGYVYVPPGRFLFGSADPDVLRQGFFDAPPLHPIDTGGYVIGADEVTFADWLAFLRDLPPRERAVRAPRTGDLLHGGLVLREVPGQGFELTLKPTTAAYTALEGALIRYPGRRQRAAQDWRRFPVTAVSQDDAQAYLSWLSRTGRVPGARLCDEHEWERAARGADGRQYPHGDTLAADDANHDATYGRDPLGFGPDEVGSHPASDSPFGVRDLAGNAWELVTSVRAEGEIVMRGGCWYEGGPTHRVMNREVVEPAFRSMLVGLRVCATWPPHRPPGSMD